MDRLEILAAAAGLLLILKAPVFAQYPAAPEEAAQTPSAATSSTQDEGRGSTDESQTLTDTDWWGQNDGWSVGYLPGWYGAGLCRSSSQLSWTGRPSTQWWNAAVTNSWFPSGQPLPYPYGSGWCGNSYGNGYRGRHLWVNQSLVSAKKHHPKHNKTPNKRMQASAENAHRKSEPAADVPDDDWTRVEDVHIRPVAATRREPNRMAGALETRRPAARQALDRRHPPEQRASQRVRVERMRGLERRQVAQARVFAAPHISVARPVAHIAVRTGGRGHS